MGSSDVFGISSVYRSIYSQKRALVVDSDSDAALAMHPCMAWQRTLRGAAALGV